MRTAWKGTITIKGIQANVKAYSANRSSTIPFVTMHKGCKGATKLEQHKFCPDCEEYVGKGHTARAFDSNGTLVPLTDEEIDSCKVRETTGIDILYFIKRDFISPRHCERSYYVVPEEGDEQTIDAMVEALSNRVGIGVANLQSRKRPAVLEASLGHLVVHLFHDHSAMRSPDDITTRSRDANSKHVVLMRRLFKQMEVPVEDIPPVIDPYRERLSALIQRKVATLAPAPSESNDKVDSLEDQLKKSLGSS